MQLNSHKAFALLHVVSGVDNHLLILRTHPSILRTTLYRHVPQNPRTVWVLYRQYLPAFPFDPSSNAVRVLDMT
jgi:hypothetical protein